MLTNKKRAQNFLMAFCACVGLVFLSAGCSPSGPNLLLAGRDALKQGNIPQAVKLLQQAVVLLGTNDQAWNYLGVAYHRDGKVAEAQKAYELALKYNPDLTVVHYNLGCLFLEQNRADLLEYANNEFAAFAVRQPRNPEAWLKWGTTQLRMNHFLDAEKSFREVLRLNPQSAEAMNNLGVALLERRRFQDASTCFANALRMEPGYAQALQNSATASLYLNNRGLALQKYREYLQLAPRAADAAEVSLIVQQMEKDMTLQAGSQHPTSPEGLVTNLPNTASKPLQGISTGSPRNGKPEPAPAPIHVPVPVRISPQSETPKPESVHSAELPQAKPANPEPRINAPVERGSSSAAAEVPRAPEEIPTTNNKPAKKSFLSRINPVNLFSRSPKDGLVSSNDVLVTPLPEPSVVAEPAVSPSPTPPKRVVSTAPVVVPRYSYMGRFKPETGNRAAALEMMDKGDEARRDRRSKDAVAAFSNAVKDDPSCFDAHMALAASAMDAGELPVALRGYESAVALKPDSFHARYGLGLALKKANYIRDAAEQLETVLSNASSNQPPSQLAITHLALGNLYADQFHQPGAARAHYLKVLELDPANPQSTSIRFWLQNNP